MIEKWEETDESMEKWLDAVRYGIEKHIDKCFESELEVVYGFHGEAVIISFAEGCYDVSDARDDNIEFIKKFISEELPYLKIKEIKSRVDPDDVGFKVILEMKA